MTFEQFGEIIEDGKEGSAPSFAEFGESLDVWGTPEDKNFSLLKKGPSDLTRVLGQIGARGVESILGAPRDVGDFLSTLTPQKTLIKGAEKIGLGEGARTLLDISEKIQPHKLLPSTEQLRGLTKELFGGSVEPKSELEEKAGQTFGEIASMVSPFLGGLKKTRAILTGVGANLAKEGAEFIGLSPTQGDMAKLGGYGIAALTNPKAGRNFYNKKFKEARNLLPEGATGSSTHLRSELEDLTKKVSSGGKTTGDRMVLKQIRNLEKEIQGDQVPIQALTDFKIKLNEVRGDVINQLQGNRAGIRRANHNLNKVADAADKALERYGSHNPQWFSEYSEANNAFGAVKNSEKLGKFYRKNLAKLSASHIGLAALLGHLGGAIKTVGATTGAYPIYAASKTLMQILKSKPLRKEFTKLYQQALKGNVKGAASAINNLDDQLPVYAEDHSSSDGQ